MNKRRWLSKNGIAVPVVIIFVFCAMTFAGAMFFFRKEVKQQNVMNVNFLQANFLAQGAIQHALLKVKFLPQETFDAGVIQLGLCPFRGVVSGGGAVTGGSNKTSTALTMLRSDMNTASRAWMINPPNNDYFTPGNWNYKVSSFTVIAAYADPTKKELVQTIRIIAHGMVNDPRGGRGVRTEEMVKTIEVRRPQ